MFTHTPALIERIEALDQAILDDYISAQQRLYPEVGAATKATACAVAIYDGAGLESRIHGFRGPGTNDRAETTQLCRWLLQRRGPHEQAGPYSAPPGARFLLSPLAHESHKATLAALGGSYQSVYNVLTRVIGPGSVVVDADGCAIVRVTRETRDQAGAVVIRGFTDDKPPSPAQMMVPASYFEVPGATHFVAVVDDTFVAGGAVIVRDGLALLTGLSVLPAYRGRHIQSALIAHRLNWALAQGADIAILGAAVCGLSQRNAERAGFRVAYPRVWVMVTEAA